MDGMSAIAEVEYFFRLRFSDTVHSLALERVRLTWLPKASPAKIQTGRLPESEGDLKAWVFLKQCARYGQGLLC
jgi:hypothetical protein